MRAPGLRAAAGLATLLAVGAGCATPLSPRQRQELETRVYEAPAPDVFAASREALLNDGYWVEESDFEGGLLTVSQTVPARDARKALIYSLLLPCAGDVYMNRYGWALLDLFTWPYSILWAAPSNYRIAQQRTRHTRGTLTFEALAPDRTRLRLALGARTEEDSVAVRRLLEAIEQELFFREGERLGEAAPAADPAPQEVPAAASGAP